MKYYTPAILWSIVILFLSTKGGINLPQSWSDLISVDKLGHAVVYGIFSVLILKAIFQANTIKKLLWPMIIAFTISTGYGILMEIIQYSFFPGRFFEVLDIIANIIGSLIGLIIFKHFFY